MTDHIKKSHNKSLLLYHLVCPIKYRRKGYYINTVGQYANEATIINYVKNQGRHYQPIHRGHPMLFEGVV